MDFTNVLQWKLTNLNSLLGRFSPTNRIQSDRQRVDENFIRIIRGMDHKLQILHTRLLGLKQRLDSLNPAAVLSRGYAVVSHQDGTIITKVEQVTPGDQLNVNVQDGKFQTEVINDE